MNAIRRIFPKIDPDSNFNAYHFHDDPWPARWIHGPALPDPSGAESELPGAWAFRKTFQCPAPETLRIHVAADQRYDLFLDGELVGRGNERGLPNSWFYESYEIDLCAGPHNLLARVWWTGTGDLLHYGHTSFRPGFLLHAEGPRAAELDTRAGTWDAARLSGYSFCPPQIVRGFRSVGARTVLDARLHDPALERGAGSDWSPALERGEIPAFRAAGDEPVSLRLLTPATLPAMDFLPRAIARVRHATANPATDSPPHPYLAAESDSALESVWAAMLSGGAAVAIPPRSRQRVLLDIGDFVCARTRLVVSGGRDARVRVFWSESLFHDTGFVNKGNRDEIEGKFFDGMGDELVCNGDDALPFTPFWWTSGRYIEVVVETADAPLRIDSLSLEETHYPVRWAFQFDCDDERWQDVLPRTRRVLEMCSHESYMDCPYYEQLMYGGDTRVEILATYATTRDDRLPRKAMLLFDRSRSESGLTLARVPSRVKQVIPTFSLWFVQMVGDYEMWRDDPAFVRARLPGIRAVLFAFREHVGPDGLLYGPRGWNFTDWVHGWQAGIAPGSDYGQADATLSLHYAWTLRVAAGLEERHGEPLLARWDRELADRIGAAVVERFWDDSRALFAEDPGHTIFTEHAQCMAVLGGFVPEGRSEALADSLASATDLARATVYFSHYLFDTWRILRRPWEIYRRLDLWFGLKGIGLKTVLEQPEPSRSDCHAWGSHPMFHALATFAGIRPDAPGFSAVRIEPQPGPLMRVLASLPHPSGGDIALDIRLENGAWHGTASTPPKTPSTLLLDGRTLSWDGGSIEL